MSVAQRAGVDRPDRRHVRARWLPMTSSRRASVPPRGRSAASSTEIPKKYRVGLVTFSSEPFVVSPLTFDRQRLLSALQYDLVPGQGTAIGDALARAVELLQPVAADGDPPAPARRAPAGDPRQAAVGDPPALGRRADARDAAAAAGRGAGEVVRDPRLHGRARHAERDAQPWRVRATRCRRTPRRCARSR